MFLCYLHGENDMAQRWHTQAEGDSGWQSVADCLQLGWWIIVGKDPILPPSSAAEKDSSLAKYIGTAVGRQTQSQKCIELKSAVSDQKRCNYDTMQPTLFCEHMKSKLWSSPTWLPFLSQPLLCVILCVFMFILTQPYHSLFHLQVDWKEFTSWFSLLPILNPVLTFSFLRWIANFPQSNLHTWTEKLILSNLNR